MRNNREEHCDSYCIRVEARGEEETRLTKNLNMEENGLRRKANSASWVTVVDD